MSTRIMGICAAAVCLSLAVRTEARRLDSSKWTVTDQATGKKVTAATDNDPETLVTLPGDELAASHPGLVVDLGQTCILHRVYLTGRRHQPEIWKSYENREKPPLGLVVAYVGDTPHAKTRAGGIRRAVRRRKPGRR